MIQTIEQKLIELKQLDETIKTLEDKKAELREVVFSQMKENLLDKYDGELSGATAYYTKRKSVTYGDKEQVLSQLINLGLTDFYETKTEISSKFESEIKEGKINFDGVLVEEKAIPTIKLK